jgi:hypothetical protein
MSANWPEQEEPTDDGYWDQNQVSIPSYDSTNASAQSETPSWLTNPDVPRDGDQPDAATPSWTTSTLDTPEAPGHPAWYDRIHKNEAWEAKIAKWEADREEVNKDIKGRWWEHVLSIAFPDVGRYRNSVLANRSAAISSQGRDLAEMDRSRQYAQRWEQTNQINQQRANQAKKTPGRVVGRDRALFDVIQSDAPGGQPTYKRAFADVPTETEGPTMPGEDRAIVAKKEALFAPEGKTITPRTNIVRAPTESGEGEATGTYDPTEGFKQLPGTGIRKYPVPKASPTRPPAGADKGETTAWQRGYDADLRRQAKIGDDIDHDSAASAGEAALNAFKKRGTGAADAPEFDAENPPDGTKRKNKKTGKTDIRVNGRWEPFTGTK